MGEPFLTKYNLKKTLSGEKKLTKETSIINNLLMYSDGTNDLISISEKIEEDLFEIDIVAKKLLRLGLLKIIN